MGGLPERRVTHRVLRRTAVTYFPDGTLLRRPSLLEWYKTRCDALGNH